MDSNKRLSYVKVIVLDFDGVIVINSEFFKEEAWRKVFAPYTGRYEHFFTEANEKFGFGKRGDRFDVLRYVLEHLGVEDIEKEVEEGAALFNDYVQKGILAEGVVAEGEEVLEKLSKKYPLYLVSGTAEEALKRSVENLGIGKYFKAVFGGPTSKGESIREIAQKEGVELSDVLLVGDSKRDILAAEDTKCQFLGVANEWNKWKKKDVPFLLIKHIREIQNHL